ncbi:MAG TPA: ABC transporter ATP-binding protein [Clostridia bacterium]
MKSILKYLRPYAKLIALEIGLLLAYAATSLALPTIMQNIINVGIKNNDLSYVLIFGAVMLAIAIVGAITSIYSVYVMTEIGQSFSRDLRVAVFEKVQKLSITKFNDIGNASLMARSTDDIRIIQDLFDLIIRALALSPFMLIGATILAVITDVKLSLIMLAVIPLMALFVLFMLKVAAPLWDKAQKFTDKMVLIMRERLMGIRVIRAFNKEDYERERFKNSAKDMAHNVIKGNNISVSINPILLLMLNSVTIAIVYFGAGRLVSTNGAIGAGQIMALIQYVSMVMNSLIEIGWVIVLMPRLKVSTSRIIEVLNAKSEIQDTGTRDISTVKGHITFDNVTFRHPGAEKAAVENISFDAPLGTTVAIIGSTGSGKSTIAKLLMRFYDVSEGKILLDGADIKEYPVKDYRSLLSYVPQTGSIFSGTIKENILNGNQNATDEEIDKACTIAMAKKFIEDKPNGLNEMIVESGNNLSGGQKQRLALARALVRNSPIYVLDDCFSALDYKTDLTIRKNLKTHFVDRTVFIITQRISTAMTADTIIVLESGKMVGIGKHKDLLKNCTVYKEIATSQLGKEAV